MIELVFAAIAALAGALCWFYMFSDRREKKRQRQREKLQEQMDRVVEAKRQGMDDKKAAEAGGVKAKKVQKWIKREGKGEPYASFSKDYSEAPQVWEKKLQCERDLATKAQIEGMLKRAKWDPARDCNAGDFYAEIEDLRTRGISVNEDP